MTDFTPLKTLTLLHFVVTLCADNENDIVVPHFLNEYNSRRACYILMWFLSDLMNSNLFWALSSTNVLSLMTRSYSLFVYAVVMNYLSKNKTLFIIITCQRKIWTNSTSNTRLIFAQISAIITLHILDLLHKYHANIKHKIRWPNLQLMSIFI